MTIVEGQVESLKKLREELERHRIDRFSSIGDINLFLKNFSNEKEKIPSDTREALKLEIKNLEYKLDQTKEKREHSFLARIFLYFQHLSLRSKVSYRKDNFERILSERIDKEKQDLKYTKDIVNSLYSVIAGGIGESQVLKELQKLPDTYFLINDFSMEFNPPLYNRSEKERIYSVQIDHLLISQAGIFLIETKNWSEKSVQDYDLRSPVMQVQRASYALFVLLNSDSKHNKIRLQEHHWGSKKIPIKNIIAMTNSKPKEEFKHVKVLTLNDLCGYIDYFDEIFSQSEVEHIFEHLRAEKA